MAKWARQRMADEAGFTLVEMLVTVMLLLIVTFSTLSLLDSGSRTATRDTERTYAIRDAQTGLNRMVKDLRQAYAIEPAPDTSANEVTMRTRMSTNAGGTTFADSFVEYDCGTTSPATCTRRQWLVSGTRPATGVPVAVRVLNAGTSVKSRQIFNFDTTADRSGSATATSVPYITVRLEVPSAGERNGQQAQYTGRIVLDDGFLARNLQIS